MADPICPAGMVLQKPEGAVHPDEPAFCINETEIPQKGFMDFLRDKFRAEYKKVRALLGPTVVGDKKPAVYAKWGMAQAYCQSTYPGGDLPTERQWENACGSGTYCTASGNLNHTEAIYGTDGPADVGSTPANPRGVQDMTGNVWEWMRDDAGDGYKRIRGGSWYFIFGYGWGTRGAGRDLNHADHRDKRVGFRCVAPPKK